MSATEMKATGDSLSSRIRRIRRWLPLCFLMGTLVVAGIGALEAHGAHRSHRQAVDRLVRDYGAFAARTYAHFAFHRVWSALDAGLRPPAPQGAEGCKCEPIAGAYAFRVPLADPVARAEFSGAAPDTAARSQIARAIAGDAVARAAPADVAALPVAAELLLYRVRADVAEGVQVDRERLVRLLDGVFARERLLPGSISRDRDNRALVDVWVTTGAGDVLYSSRGAPFEPPTASAVAEPPAGNLIVHAAIRPGIAGDLLVGGLPRSRLPMLLGVFALAAVLAVLAVVQLHRESQLVRMREDFIGSVSHELRTPLTQIRLYNDTMRLGRYTTDEQRQRALDAVDRETQRLVHLIDNVLMARGGSGIAARERIELAAEIPHIVQSFAPIAEARRTAIVTDVPDGLAVVVHRNSFRQVILNLLDNALKYGPAGQTVTVRAARTGSLVAIRVEDEGPGVPPRERKLIWQPFRRGRDSIGSVVVGSGIGLAVVRDIVREHGGAVRVEAAPSGASFVIELPDASALREERVG